MKKIKILSSKPLPSNKLVTLLLVVMLFAGGTGAVFASNVGGIVDKAFEIFASDIPIPEEIMRIISDAETKEKAKEKAEELDINDGKPYVDTNELPLNPPINAEAYGDSANNININTNSSDDNYYNYDDDDDDKAEGIVNELKCDIDFDLKFSGRKDKAIIIGNVKKLVAENDLDENQFDILDGFIRNEDNSETLFCMYSFLFENFFTEYDLNDALARYGKGEGIDSITQDYFEKDDGFVAHSYPEGQIEFLVFEKGVGINELAVAEILDYRGVSDIESLLDDVIKGQSLSEAFVELGVLNYNCKLQSISVSSDTVGKMSSELCLSESDTIKAIARAKRAKIADSEIASFLRSSKASKNSAGHAIAIYYMDKFGGANR